MSNRKQDKFARHRHCMQQAAAQADTADHGAQCNCAPGRVCSNCITKAEIAPGAQANDADRDRDALNRHVAEAQGAADPSTAVKPGDGSVTMGQLGIGNEFTIRPGGLTTYLAVAADPSNRLIVAHNVTPGADFPTVLHIPNSQKVWPSLPVPVVPEPPKVIVPTVGRKVWFYPGSGMWPAGMQVFPGTDYDGGVQQPLDATIVYVHDDRLVNLRVIDHAGHAFPVRSVQLVQPGDECCGAGHRAEWMPFQVKQAGKA